MDDLFNSDLKSKPAGPVECFGLAFTDDEERRKHFLGILREKLKDPVFRKIEGFPIGADEDILALSDPPYYTACPNPWIADFIREWSANRESRVNESQDDPSAAIRAPQTYHREPFAADVSEGKNDPVYNAHSYHTKVPHKAIMRYILHYTGPGDVVFDGFCGTGMTGVAAQLCGDRATVESLGYRVDDLGIIYQQVAEGHQDESRQDGGSTVGSTMGHTGNSTMVWQPFSKLGARHAILNDLSPAATFIAYNYNTPVDVEAFAREAKRILSEVEAECGWMYETLHVEPASSRLLSSIDFEPCNPYEATQAVYRKDNLPHFQVAGATYFITFRTHRQRVLSDEAREIALKAALHWHNRRWRLFSAVVMPDHLHIVAKPLPKGKDGYWDLAEVLHSVKSFSANEINKAEKKTGLPVWQTESYDRVIRDADELLATLAYINHNPVKAGLAGYAEEYAFRYMAEELVKAGWKPAPLGKINYTVWSDVFVCPECTREVIFWEAAVDKEAGKVHDTFPCPHCAAQLTKRRMDRAWVTKHDPYITQSSSDSRLEAGSTFSPQSSIIRQAKQVPVLINYTVEPDSSGAGFQPAVKKRFVKSPDFFDLELIQKIEELDIPCWFPTDRMPDGDESRRNDVIGLTHVHHFYTKRNLWVLGAITAKLVEHSHRRNKAFLRFLFHQWVIGFSLLNRYSPHHYSQNNRNLSGTLYVGSQISEVSPEYAFPEKIKRLVRAFGNYRLNPTSVVTTLDASMFNSADQTVDYIFTDPPFGGNLMYSELNFLWEAWLKVFTNNKAEAIENSVQGKGLAEYQKLMTACFKEYFRVLKPGRWMTVEFHNSKNSVWNAIQEALQAAGFVIADVRTLDKQQGSFKQVTSANAVKQDLVISCYKPNGGLEERFKLDAGTEAGVWDFVRAHLRQLPILVLKSGNSRLEAGSTSTIEAGSTIEIIAERQNHLLFDRMLAFHVQRGVTVPMSASEFYAGLAQRFSERDGMYFLPEQVAEYEKKRMTVREVLQLQLIVTDESSAIQWLKQQLLKKPQTFQELHPQFLREIGGWQKHEKLLELSELLEQNFLRCDLPAAAAALAGGSAIPAQLVSWLKQSEEMRKVIQEELGSGRATEDNGQLITQASALIARSKDRWYVPDPNKAGDLERLRERSLLKEFQEYAAPASTVSPASAVAPASSRRKLKLFRLEAVRAGFKKAWADRDYATIITVARKIPENVLMEDPKLLMWYDQALTRTGEE